MKKNGWICCIFMLSLHWIGCEKIVIQDPIDKNKAFFNLDFIMDGENIQLGTGRNDYVAPGFFIDELGIRVFTSTFYTQNEQGESSKLSIVLRDDRVFSPSNLDTISFFKPGDYFYRIKPQQVEQAEVMSNALENPQQFQNVFWGNSTQYNETRSGTGRFFHQEIPNQSQQLITSAIMTGQNDCETFYFKSNRPKSVDIELLDFVVEGNVVRPLFSHPDASNVTFLWLGWNDPEAPADIHSENQLLITEKGYYGLVLIYNSIDPISGEELSAQTWVRMYFDIQDGILSKSDCFYRLSSKEVNAFSESPDFSQVIIEWTDVKGVTYTSNLTDSGPSPSFVILENEAFTIKDEKGNNVRLLMVEFSCILTSPQGQTIELKQATGRIAFSY